MSQCQDSSSFRPRMSKISFAFKSCCFYLDIKLRMADLGLQHGTTLPSTAHISRALYFDS